MEESALELCSPWVHVRIGVEVAFDVVSLLNLDEIAYDLFLVWVKLIHELLVVHVFSVLGPREPLRRVLVRKDGPIRDKVIKLLQRCFQFRQNQIPLVLDVVRHAFSVVLEDTGVQGDGIDLDWCGFPLQSFWEPVCFQYV